MTCTCEFDPYDDLSKERSYHYKRVCKHCGHEWYGLHCIHDGYQNPCPECKRKPDPIKVDKDVERYFEAIKAYDPCAEMYLDTAAKVAEANAIIADEGRTQSRPRGGFEHSTEEKPKPKWGVLKGI